MRILFTASILLLLSTPFFGDTFNIGNIRDSNLKVAMRYYGNTNISQLSNLVLNGHQITDISELGKLTQLERLELYHNSIIDISPLSNLINLKKLYIGKNQIRDISVLSNLVNLTALDIHHNNISSILPLMNLSNLNEIDMRGINIDLENFDYWQFISNLQIYDITGKWKEIKASEKKRWGLKNGEVVPAWIKY
jgi:hypothetical protein